VTGDCMGLWGQDKEIASGATLAPQARSVGLVHVSSAEEGVCEWMPWRHGDSCSPAVGSMAVCDVICIYQYAGDFAPHGARRARTRPWTSLWRRRPRTPGKHTLRLVHVSSAGGGSCTSDVLAP
jgi:hypothetical protein